jgi:hypothetical protein
MRIPQRAGRALFAALLLTGPVVLIGCSRPTAAPGQQLPTQPGGRPAGYPSGSAPESAGTPLPGPGTAGYPPPRTAEPTVEDPYPGKTQTAEAGGGAPAPTATTASP